MIMLPSQAASLRARAWDAGFLPVAVYNPDAAVPKPQQGKAPKGKRWQERALQDPPEAAVAEPELDALNTGILANGLRAIDLDIDNPTLAHRCRSLALDHFGEAPVRTRRDSPRSLLLYRAADGEPSKRVLAGKLGKVEVLGKGQQFVAWGTHPDGADLEWFPEQPGEIARDALPAITEDQITAYLLAVAPIIDAATQRINGHDQARIAGEPQADPLRVAAALASIPNGGAADWEHWNRIGMATWRATAGSALGREAFIAWSAKHPSFDAAATSERWEHYRRSPPTDIGAGTLFKLAGEANEPPPAEENPYDEAAPPFWESVDVPLTEAPAAQEAKPEQRRSSVIDPRNWTAPAPLRQWVVDGWIPRGYVTGLYGDGATGKSLLAQQLLTCIATRRSWLNLTTTAGNAFGFMCEDDEDELHRRQEAVNRHYGTTMSELESLRYASRVGADNLLMTFDERNRGFPTDLMGKLGQFLAQFRPAIVVLDTLADIFGGDEVKRAQARLFVQGIGGNIARTFDCAVVIAAHPSQTGLSTGSGTGGSTAWNNTFRSRLYLTKTEGSGEIRTLARMKANYAPVEGELKMRWENGAFALQQPEIDNTAGLDWQQTLQVFNEIERRWEANRPLSLSPQTKQQGRYLPLWAEVTLGVKQRDVLKAAERWLSVGLLGDLIRDTHHKVRGLKVLRRPDAEPGAYDDQAGPELDDVPF